MPECSAPQDRVGRARMRWGRVWGLRAPYDGRSSGGAPGEWCLCASSAGADRFSYPLTVTGTERRQLLSSTSSIPSASVLAVSGLVLTVLRLTDWAGTARDVVGLIVCVLMLVYGTVAVAVGLAERRRSRA